MEHILENAKENVSPVECYSPLIVQKRWFCRHWNGVESKEQWISSLRILNEFGNQRRETTQIRIGV